MLMLLIAVPAPGRGWRSNQVSSVSTETGIPSADCRDRRWQAALKLVYDGLLQKLAKTGQRMLRSVWLPASRFRRVASPRFRPGRVVAAFGA